MRTFFLYMTVAVSVTGCVFTSCNGRLPEQAKDDPVGIYRDYLHVIRKSDSLAFEELAGHIGQWQTIKDSVFNRVRRDTAGNHGHDFGKTCESIHDSLRMEFSRLALSEPRSYQELLQLKRRLSPHTEDKELHQRMEDIRPFFNSLNAIPVHKGSKVQILTDYRALLAYTLREGIHGINDVKTFIKKEDAVFRAFLPYMHSLDGENMADITHDTEKCCSQILLAAERKEIPYQDAVVYLAMRTGRRVILNTRTCINDIRNQRIRTKAQAHAYIWMLLQPYVSLDSFCLTVLSVEEQEQLNQLAAQTPDAFKALCGILHPGANRLEELPGMLMEIYIHTL